MPPMQRRSRRRFHPQHRAAGGLLLAARALVPGCASVPLSTIDRVSTFDEKDFA